MTSDNVTGYTYFRNNVQISVRSSNSYTLSNNSRVDDGNYSCEVTTSKAPRSPKADPVAVMFLCKFMSWKCNEYPIVHFLTLFRQIFQIFGKFWNSIFSKFYFVRAFTITNSWRVRRHWKRHSDPDIWYCQIFGRMLSSFQLHIMRDWPSRFYKKLTLSTTPENLKA